MHEDTFLSRLARTLDPYCQSFLFFRWTPGRLFFLAAAIAAVYFARQSGLIHTLLQNIFVYLPNYLTHEFAHRIVGGALSKSMIGCTADFRTCYPVSAWLTTIAGNGVETLVPLAGIWAALRLQGGRWLLPPLFYWLGTTWYDAAVYVSDARACKLPLTSSDMMTNFAPGTKGDWYYILEPLGMLEYDIYIGYAFYFLAAVCLVLAVYSLWYYWTHGEEMMHERPVRRTNPEDELLRALPPAQTPSAPSRDINLMPGESPRRTEGHLPRIK